MLSERPICSGENQLELIEKVTVIHGEESVTLDYVYSEDNASLEIDIETVDDKK